MVYTARELVAPLEHQFCLCRGGGGGIFVVVLFSTISADEMKPLRKVEANAKAFRLSKLPKLSETVL